MKRTNVIYWIATILFAVFMLFTGVTNAIKNEESVQLVHTQLGYPIYFIPFIGIAKIAGALVLLIPGRNRIKEWAYAGLMFDLVGALYSLLMIGGGMQAFFGMIIPIIVGSISYIYYHKKYRPV